MNYEQAQAKKTLRALILVDIQNDFIDGALAVPKGNEVVEVANRLMTSGDYRYVIATQDWHPPDHGSFASVAKVEPFTLGTLGGRPQVMWPDHCIWDRMGAAFAPTLRRDLISKVITKGSNRNADSYSGFKDDDGTPTGLAAYLQGLMVKHVDIIGLATDYCVKATAIDARKMGGLFEVRVIREGCRGVNMHPDDSEKAFIEMAQAGVRILNRHVA